MSLADVANGERFERIGLPADAGVAAHTRREFADWLSQFFDLDHTQRSDVLLAINEALANAAEFAYLLIDRPGTMDMYADYDPASERLTVHVSDHGLWRMPVATAASRTRGRGLPLMRALSDDVALDTSAGGTKVRLQWNGVGRR
ncbi:ATP-binding protein [Mycobacterium sp. MMS18-G62]